MFGVGGDGKVESPIYKADSVKIGDVTVRTSPWARMEQPAARISVMDGILGPTLLADFIITMDYPRNQIQLSRKAPEGGTVVPAWFFGGLLMVPVEVNGKHKGNFLIDSGADSTLLAYTMANSLGVNKDTPGSSRGSAHRGHRRPGCLSADGPVCNSENTIRNEAV
jgi:hypothetical protein